MMEKENANACLCRIEDRERHQNARSLLRDRYGIAGEVIRAAALANVLGMTAQSIRKGMQSGQFFLPCTRILSSTVVKVEDLVRWLCEHEPLTRNAKLDSISQSESMARIKEQALVNMRKTQAIRRNASKD